MFWGDEIAQKIKERGNNLEWVDDMKTPSGRIHVGALRAILSHDFVFKSLQDLNVNAKFTYVFDNHDPMDGLPVYLDKNKYEKYMGMPLFLIPSPEEGAKNFAEFYALEFKNVFNLLDCNPEIIWATDLYLSGKMNVGIKKCLDNSEKIRTIYSELYKKKIPSDWFPFNVYCQSCGKVSTTKVTDWDGEMVKYDCRVDAVDWTRGCGFSGRISPFPSEGQLYGKLPWKIEWAVKWQAIGVTVEGAGKDHMTAGGSHDLAKRIAEEILNYKTPFSFSNEFFLIGGKKMSSSRGRGAAAKDILELIPQQIVRFLIAKTKLNQAINFDPEEPDTIPRLFDEYQEYGKHYFSNLKDDYARIFEKSQTGKAKQAPDVRFSTLAQWVQMPDMESEIEKKGGAEWAKFARVWVDRYANEKDKFVVQNELPSESVGLSSEQKKYLVSLIPLFEKDLSAEDIQEGVYDRAKEKGVSSKEAFNAIYTAFLGKDHGPKAGWLLSSLDGKFVTQRLDEASR